MGKIAFNLLIANNLIKFYNRVNMKKFIIIFFIVLFNSNYGYTHIVENVEKDRQKCFEANSQSDYTMAKCNYKAIEMYNNEITKLLKNFRTILTKSQYKLLINSQNHWKQFVKNDNALLENTLETKFYFEPYLIGANIKFENYKQRYQELFDLYEYFEKQDYNVKYKKNETISLNEFLYAKDAPKNWKELSINKKGDVIYNNKIVITDNGYSINESTASESYLLLKIFLIASGAKPKEGCDTSDYKNGIYGLGCYIYESE